MFRSVRSVVGGVSSREGRVSLGDAFLLVSGERLESPTVEFRLTGPTDGPVVVVLGGISAHRHVCRWWPAMVGVGLPIDVDRVRVLGFDWLGDTPRCFPPTVRSADRNYPLISTRDQARALFAILDELGVDSVHGLVGSSYGGMVGLAAAVEYPRRVERLIVISGAHRPHPMATAHRAIQRAIVGLGHASNHGEDGLVLARALAMTTYRTVEEFEGRFGSMPLPGTDGLFEVEEYLYARGRAYCDRFDPRSFAALSHSIDLHSINPEEVVAEVDLISVDSDNLVPAWLMDELAESVTGPCRHHRLQSRWGHDAFLKEPEAIGGLLSEIFAPTDPTPPTAGARHTLGD